MGKILQITNGDHAIQAFPLIKGGINLTSTDGEQKGVNLIHCVSAGSLTITWHDGTTTGSPVDMSSGDDYAVDAYSVTIVSGTFHMA